MIRYQHQKSSTDSHCAHLQLLDVRSNHAALPTPAVCASVLVLNARCSVCESMQFAGFHSGCDISEEYESNTTDV